MKAIGYQTAHPIDHPESLLDITLPDPVATGHDLLVEVHAVSVNPVDTKVRKSSSRSGDGPDYKVLGWDASGIVRAVGPEVTLFQPGDRVWYAGSIARAGTNSELHLVDERIVGHAPKSLDFAEAAALPLTTITAWELLFDRLGVAPGKQPTNKTLLIIGASGGVGSILTQLAARLTSLTIIGTASRPETQQWVRDLGAHHVIDHSQPLTQELARIGHTLQPLDIVVVNTRAGSRYGHKDYLGAGCGMGYEATMYLLERGVRLTGTDAWSWDAPFSYTAQRVAETGNKALIWEGHKAGRDIGYCHLEKLHNLEALPPTGFTISCFPHKIRGASAGWTRAVAIFED